MRQYTEEEIDKIFYSDDLSFLEEMVDKVNPNITDFTKEIKYTRLILNKRCKFELLDVFETGSLKTKVTFEDYEWVFDGDITNLYYDSFFINNGNIQFLQSYYKSATNIQVYKNQIKLYNNSIIVFNSDTKRLEMYKIAEGVKLFGNNTYVKQLLINNGFVVWIDGIENNNLVENYGANRNQNKLDNIENNTIETKKRSPIIIITIIISIILLFVFPLSFLITVPLILIMRSLKNVKDEINIRNTKKKEEEEKYKGLTERQIDYLKIDELAKKNNISRTEAYQMYYKIGKYETEYDKYKKEEEFKKQMQRFNRNYEND
ncbi:MAG: hypothetical protein MJ211_07480 [Bacteroidales bacterium]|nr:hypothetical protein [Bacteroidales bacterium]